jgi:hypothetical protein
MIIHGCQGTPDSPRPQYQVFAVSSVCRDVLLLGGVPQVVPSCSKQEDRQNFGAGEQPRMNANEREFFEEKQTRGNEGLG